MCVCVCVCELSISTVLLLGHSGFFHRSIIILGSRPRLEPCSRSEPVFSDVGGVPPLAVPSIPISFTRCCAPFLFSVTLPSFLQPGLPIGWPNSVASVWCGFLNSLLNLSLLHGPGPCRDATRHHTNDDTGFAVEDLSVRGGKFRRGCCRIWVCYYGRRVAMWEVWEEEEGGLSMTSLV